jgi:SET domain-containing protein
MLPASTFKNDLVYTDKSPIHGLGLFAKVNIKKDTCICNYIGDTMTLREYKNTGGIYKYCYRMQRINRIIDGRNYKTENPSHYCNESNTPNVIMKKKGLYALSDIAQGSECFLKFPANYPRDYVL